MEDCCAVCAEPLEWVAFGPCNHKDVCSMCTTRMRFVMKDKKCCICKQECSSVFITKALGDYTRPAGDFEALPMRVIRQGSKQGDLWYEPEVEAYFDDFDHFRMIKATCKLSCSLCEDGVPGPVNVNTNPNMPPAKGGPVQRGHTFKAIDQLKRHLSQYHKISMCDLCLEGRKVFVSEQKLYTRPQLEQHSAKGNSSVDGTEEERGGFQGHPQCHFCRRRFYGDNELYQHMTTEHFSCHICQRNRPGSYEYFRNYDDLEAHFRHDHFLCEDNECLAQKFVVFPSEMELKRHNAQTHGGNMSRSERNRALQIPATQLFEFRRLGGGGHNQEDVPGGNRRGHHGRQPGQPSVALVPHPDSMQATMRASMETASVEAALRESAALSPLHDPPRMPAGGLSERTSYSSGGTGHSDMAFPPLASGEEGGGGNFTLPGYRDQLGASWIQTPGLTEGSFPPLPGTSKSAKRRAKARGMVPGTSLATLLGASADGSVKILHARTPAASMTSSSDWPSPGGTGESSSRAGSSSSQQAIRSQDQSEAATRRQSSLQSGAPGEGHMRDAQMNTGETIGSALQREGQDVGSLSPEELKAANRALVEKIREGLRGSEEQFADFKDVSAQFRRGHMGALAYYGHVARLGLSNVVPDLARLCPDPDKQRELLEAYAAGSNAGRVSREELLCSPSLLPRPAGAGSGPPLPSGASRKGKGKAVEGETSSNSGLEEGSAPSHSSNVGLGLLGRSLGPPAAATALVPAPAPVTFGAAPNSVLAAGLAEVQLSNDGYRRSRPQQAVETVRGGEAAPGRSPGPGGAVAAPQNEATVNPSRLRKEVAGLHGSASAPNLNGQSLVTSGNSEVSGWACSVCTLQNEDHVLRCSACGSVRPGLVRRGSNGSFESLADYPGDDQEEGAGTSVEAGKRKKKGSKFQRMRLGDAMAAGIFGSTEVPDLTGSSRAWGSPIAAQPTGGNIRGAWRNGGGSRLAKEQAAINSAWGQAK